MDSIFDYVEPAEEKHPASGAAADLIVALAKALKDAPLLERNSAVIAEQQASIAALRSRVASLETDLREAHLEAARPPLSLVPMPSTQPLPSAPMLAEPSTRPKIELLDRRGADGLLRRVVLKADGFDDVAIDIPRGVDNRIVFPLRVSA